MSRPSNPNRVRVPTRRIASDVLATLSTVWLAGCVSTDPAPDIAEAADVVTARAGVAPDWNGPWERDKRVWSGDSPLSSHVAVEAALQANRSLRSGIATIAEARADVAQAGLLPNPVVSVAYGLALDGRSGDAVVAALTSQLNALWTRSTRVETEEARLRATILTTSDVALRLVAEVRSLHARLVHAERSLRWEDEALERAREADRIAHEAFEVGTTTIDARNAAGERRLAAERRRATRAATVERLRRELLHAMGQADADARFTTDDQVVLPDGIESRESLDKLEGLEALNERTLLDRARTLRLDIAAALATLDAEARQIVLAQLDRIPSMRAGVGFERNLEGREGAFPRVEIEIPILDTGGAAEARARASAGRASFDTERVLEDAVHDVRHARVAVEEALALHRQVARQDVALTTETASSAAIALNGGVIPRDVWLRAETKRLHALSGLEDAEARLAASLFDLQRAVGGSFER